MYNIVCSFSRLARPLGKLSVSTRPNTETLVEIGDSVRGRDVFILQTGTNKLEVRVGRAELAQTSCLETKAEIMESVREKSVYIIQTGINKDVNNHIMELLIMAYACKTSSARNIVGVIPYMPYCKQSKMRKRGCIVSKLLAKMMCKAGLTHVITMDLHQKEIQGFFDCPVDNLRASPFLLQYIQESIPDYRNSVIVARDPGSAKKATSYAERLRLGEILFCLLLTWYNSYQQYQMNDLNVVSSGIAVIQDDIGMVELIPYKVDPLASRLFVCLFVCLFVVNFDNEN
ncbi:hypothetical protein HAZT_HAZT007010 [Hyalella azteca]|uniref:Ribose-phosphate pyrophosphokinase N-terminal domain-containing protein n=1 Tax=Hyalella azteca TaxID=294128 RepID=A0A6A0H1A4_HYAAZ|nr:hypothetical protein HAZT_HAZT007010 [Hyalella azteca]